MNEEIDQEKCPYDTECDMFNYTCRYAFRGCAFKIVLDDAKGRALRREGGESDGELLHRIQTELS